MVSSIKKSITSFVAYMVCSSAIAANWIDYDTTKSNQYVRFDLDSIIVIGGEDFVVRYSTDHRFSQNSTPKQISAAVKCKTKERADLNAAGAEVQYKSIYAGTRYEQELQIACSAALYGIEYNGSNREAKYLINLAQLFEHELVGQVKKEVPLNLLHRAAEMRDSEAAYLLSLEYRYAISADFDATAAIKWKDKARELERTDGNEYIAYNKVTERYERKENNEENLTFSSQKTFWCESKNKNILLTESCESSQKVIYGTERAPIQSSTLNSQSKADPIKDKIAFYERFIKESNGIPAVEVAKKNLAELKLQQVSREVEDALWIQSMEQNTIKSYEEFVASYPNSVKVEIAKKKISELTPAKQIVTASVLPMAPVSQQSQSEAIYANRKALVIGNDSYKTVTKLLTAKEDAISMAEGLKKVGYQVTLKTDLDMQAMKATIRNFKAQIEGGDEVALFYAGHGVQLANTNYLLPIDISGETEEQIKDDAIPLQRLLDDISDKHAKFTLAMVDACRDNPFKAANGRSIGGTRGLSPTTAATGQMIVFSAGTGQQALDKLGPNDKDKNGVFTRVFLKQLDTPGITIDKLVRNVRTEVVGLAKTVGHEQVPAIYDQVVGEFYFRK